MCKLWWLEKWKATQCGGLTQSYCQQQPVYYCFGWRLLFCEKALKGCLRAKAPVSCLRGSLWGEVSGVVTQAEWSYTNRPCSLSRFYLGSDTALLSAAIPRRNASEADHLGLQARPRGVLWHWLLSCSCQQRQRQRQRQRQQRRKRRRRRWSLPEHGRRRHRVSGSAWRLPCLQTASVRVYWVAFTTTDRAMHLFWSLRLGQMWSGVGALSVELLE